MELPETLYFLFIYNRTLNLLLTLHTNEYTRKTQIPVQASAARVRIIENAAHITAPHIIYFSTCRIPAPGGRHDLLAAAAAAPVPVHQRTCQGRGYHPSRCLLVTAMVVMVEAAVVLAV